ncbi:nuclear transport factor 2 family protein [Pseudomonas frederiksbergensis]|uniref:SnoaL-like domain-containing protein n=1 Tax=Pseudomonas frederiksbergensis TaxID=104087 RepID=A0AB33ECW8_9PSED|nr:nuclear transport factor 2 family protein [Pseudomonas frederiksbergensis]ATE78224.1 hypothetical protein CNN82_17985 [Pseudomonas frederiksbergensis]
MLIADKIALQELNYLYAQYIDFHQVDEWVALFSEDAVLDERPLGFGVHEGRVAIRAYAEMLAASVLHAAHLVPNILVAGVGSDEATGSVLALVEAVTRDQCRMRYQISYEDSYVRQDGEWLFRKRVVRSTVPPEIMRAGSIC